GACHAPVILRSSASPSISACAKRLEPVEQRLLAGVDLVARLSQREPGRAIDFGKGLHAAAARRPFHFEGVAHEAIDVEVALKGKGFDLLSAALPDTTECLQRTGRPLAQFLGELAPCGGLERLAFRGLAFGNRPGPGIPALPKGSARVNEENLN